MDKYRKNEKTIMKKLGLIPTKGSGCGWIEKADGQNDKIMCELKSTEKQSISVKELDICKLESQAAVSKKIPVFAINYINNNSIYLVIRPEYLSEIVNYLETGEYKQQESCVDYEELECNNENKIKSDKTQRDKFWQIKQKEWEKWKKK